MVFLAPLYILGALAIAAPILFHLIRRTPSGRQAFSSLMFLNPSPPRLTRRSRLSNILLLILRAAALALLAFAFMRPFFESPDASAASQPRGRRVAILVDTSASMQRADLWQQAKTQLDKTIADLKPEDEAALYFFDRAVRPGMTFAEWNELTPSVRREAMKARAAGVSPSWASTRLGEALASTADLVADEPGRKPTDPPPSGLQVVLIGDLQQGGHAEALQGHQWPAGVMLQVHVVAARNATDASLHAVAATVDDSPDDANKLRVRVTNHAGATKEQFKLEWANAAGPVGVPPVDVYVPGGQSRLVRVPWPWAGALAPDVPTPDRLVLTGDDGIFDNTLYVTPLRKDALRLVYVGDDAAEDVNGLRFYLHRAIADTPTRQVEFIARSAGESNGLADADLIDARLVVVTSALADEKALRLRKFAETGGAVLVVLKDAAAGASLERLAGVESLNVTEAPAKNFSLVARTELDHPLMRPLAEPKYADFTKVHFWKHRRLTPPPDAQVAAWFDDGSPFLVQFPVGKGKVVAMTAGWQPADSQFALSSKFLPLLNGLVRRADALDAAAQRFVYEAIPLPANSANISRTISPPGAPTVELGGQTSVPADRVDRPGVYRLKLGDEESPIAINLPPDESRTAPLPPDELEKYGAKLGVAQTAADVVAKQRQLRTAELEGRQKLWRWLILATLAVLLAETLVAGRLAGKSSRRMEPVAVAT